MSSKAARVALVSMPFIALNRPSLATALLKAIVERQGIACDVHNLFIDFAERIGLSLYERLSIVSDRQLLGERLFASHVFGHRFRPELKLPSGYDPSDTRESHAGVMQKLSEQPGQFLDDCIKRVPWGQYSIIGFSTMFEQNLASLGLAKRIKHLSPETVIVFGGANCEGEMGVELLRQFAFIDYVCSGEGDQIFPEMVKRILEGRPVPRFRGLFSREETLTNTSPGFTTIEAGHSPRLNLDDLPFPDYDDYFEQLGSSSLSAAVNVAGGVELPFETSRGCWYGAKHHCTFCGLNGDTISYRSKSPARALGEIQHLSGRYKVTCLQATDNILDTRYIAELVPRLAECHPKPSLFYEIKANLRRDQLASLKRAGIDRLQPGIESLSTPILHLMRKGCTALQNVQTLKWASELQLQIYWNFLMGFPGEDPAEYGRIAEMIPAILHLPPPLVTGFVRLDRFSPYFTAPDHLGMVRVRPAPPYAEIYDLPEDSIRRLAYFFHYDYADGREPERYTESAVRMIRFWQQNYCAYSFTSLACDNELILRDRRPGATQEYARLSGIERAVFEFLDSAHPLHAIEKHLREMGHETDETGLLANLEDWRRKHWITTENDSYLALAVRMDDSY